MSLSQPSAPLSTTRASDTDCVIEVSTPQAKVGCGANPTSGETGRSAGVAVENTRHGIASDSTSGEGSSSTGLTYRGNRPNRKNQTRRLKVAHQRAAVATQTRSDEPIEPTEALLPSVPEAEVQTPSDLSGVPIVNLDLSISEDERAIRGIRRLNGDYTIWQYVLVYSIRYPLVYYLLLVSAILSTLSVDVYVFIYDIYSHMTLDVGASTIRCSMLVLAQIFFWVVVHSTVCALCYLLKQHPTRYIFEITEAARWWVIDRQLLAYLRTRYFVPEYGHALALEVGRVTRRWIEENRPEWPEIVQCDQVTKVLTNMSLPSELEIHALGTISGSRDKAVAYSSSRNSAFKY
jgi:hypothetical protein